MEYASCCPNGRCKTDTDTDIRKEMENFIFEGYEQISSALAFTIYCLSQNVEAQQKAFEEAESMTGRESRTMKYLEAVINEALRLYPSVPLYGRLLKTDYEINGFKIPKGIGITIAPFLTHRDKNFYLDPEKLMPERFLTDIKMHPYQFVPFGAGERNCIGQKFANYTKIAILET